MSTLIELAGRLDDDAGIVHAFATGIYDDLRDQIVRDLRDAAAALRAAETGHEVLCDRRGPGWQCIRERGHHGRCETITVKEA